MLLCGRMDKTGPSTVWNTPHEHRHAQLLHDKPVEFTVVNKDVFEIILVKAFVRYCQVFSDARGLSMQLTLHLVVQLQCTYVLHPEHTVSSLSTVPIQRYLMKGLKADLTGPKIIHVTLSYFGEIPRALKLTKN